MYLPASMYLSLVLRKPININQLVVVTVKEKSALFTVPYNIT
jgi:hypothetical protein